jgi:apolipoprotein D and lipocalin family protein
MKTACSLLLAASLLGAAAAAFGDAHPLPRVEPQRMAGTWYELARLPDNMDRGCASDTTDHYAARPDGSFTITSSCRTPTGKLETDVGHAWPAGDDRRNAARMKVSFMPQGLQWLPIKRAEWWVVMLDPANRFAVVSEPSGRHLKVLARSPTLPAEQLGRIVDRLAAEGYPARKLVLTKQSATVREIGSDPAVPFTARPRLIVRAPPVRDAA